MRILHGRLSRPAEADRIGCMPSQRRLGLMRAPRLRAHTAERDARILHLAAAYLHHHCHRRQRKFICRAVPQLQIQRLCSWRRRRQRPACNHIAWLEHGLPMRCRARHQVKLRDWHRARTLRALHLHRRFKRRQRHVLVRGIGRNTLLAGAQDRQHPVMPVDRRATGTRLALVARMRRIAKIHATRPLQEVAACRRHVAQLRRGPRQIRLRKHRVVAQHNRMVRHIRIPRERTDHQPAARSCDYLVHRQPVDVDHLPWPLHRQLHHVQQIGSAGNEAQRRISLDSGRAWRFGPGLHGITYCRCT